MSVAGHLFEEGKAGSLVDDRGHFYKPIQPGPRGDRELTFYTAIREARARDKAAWQQGTWSPAAVAAVQAAAAGRPIDGAALQSPTTTAALLPPPSPRRSRAPTTPPTPSSRAIPVPASPSSTGMPHFPTFRAEPSFREGAAGPIRDPVEVLERDELGLIDELVEEEMLRWSDEEEGGVMGAGRRGVGGNRLCYGYSRSPDSDEGGWHATGDHVMDGVEMAHSSVDAAAQLELLSQAALAAAKLAERNGHSSGRAGGRYRRSQSFSLGSSRRVSEEQQAQHAQQAQLRSRARRSDEMSREENSQAAALLGQPSWDLLREESPPGAGSTAPAAPAVSAMGARSSSDGHFHEYQDQQQQQQHAGAAWRLKSPRGLPPRGSNASALSTDSIEEALRVHNLSLHTRSPSPLMHLHSSATEHSINENDIYNNAAATLPPLPPHHDSSSSKGESIDDDAIVSAAAVASLFPAPTSPMSPRRSSCAFRSMPFSVRHAPLLRVIPKFYGVTHTEGRVLLELEDLARWYRHPCIMDVKVGHQTWYPNADAAYIDRCRRKDAATTQAALGFKICGMQVYRHARGGYWRASKRWCKTLPELLVDKALTSFAHNEHGLRPVDVYGGASGAVAQLRALEAWFEMQREFRFYSASLLIMYEGDATGAEGAAVRVRLVDFAHTFHADGGGVDGRHSSASAQEGEPAAEEPELLPRDENFLGGLRAIVARLTAVSRLEMADSLM